MWFYFPREGGTIFSDLATLLPTQIHKILIKKVNLQINAINKDGKSFVSDMCQSEGFDRFDVT